jgi:hypothetical protein
MTVCDYCWASLSIIVQHQHVHGVDHFDTPLEELVLDVIALKNTLAKRKKIADNLDSNGNSNNPKKQDEWTPFAISETSERPEDHDEIRQMVDGRDTARAERDFDTADDIRNQLLDRNMYIDDKRRPWGMVILRRIIFVGAEVLFPRKMKKWLCPCCESGIRTNVTNATKVPMPFVTN